MMNGHEAAQHRVVLRAAETLLAEEARMAMMVGVAVGWALHDELTESSDYEREDR